jgi:hypothetical protein
MCGIVGMFIRRANEVRRATGPNRVADLFDRKALSEAFTKMFISSQSRGSDACGIMMMRDVGAYSVNATTQRYQMDVLKSPLAAEDLVRTREYAEFMSKFGDDTIWIVGHTRAATKGDAGEASNNHPHQAGVVIGVHNGSLRNHEALLKSEAELAKKLKSDCDSELLIALLNNSLEMNANDGSQLDRMKIALTSANRKVIDLGAVVSCDLRFPHTLWLYRDESRPLHSITYHFEGESKFPHEDLYAFASTPELLAENLAGLINMTPRELIAGKHVHTLSCYVPTSLSYQNGLTIIPSTYMSYSDELLQMQRERAKVNALQGANWPGNNALN